MPGGNVSPRRKVCCAGGHAGTVRAVGETRIDGLGAVSSVGEMRSGSGN